MIKILEYENKKAFILNTDNTAYCFKVMETNHLEHLYYGKTFGNPDKLSIDDILAMSEKKEFEEGKGVKYNPYLVDLIKNNPNLIERLEDLTQYKRPEYMYRAYTKEYISEQ